MIPLLLAALAWASEPCEMPDPPPASLSVAWVSPLSSRTSNAAWLDVVPMRQLAAWVREHPEATTGDLLRHLGLRKSKREPKGRYKVVVFEVSNGALCRPIAGAVEGSTWAGLPVCEGSEAGRGSEWTECGRLRDRTTGEEGPEAYRARWRDLAPRGFCVLPAERFLAEGGR